MCLLLSCFGGFIGYFEEQLKFRKKEVATKMSKTPIRANTFETVSVNYSPKEIASPNKDFPGISRIVFTHVSNLHRLITDWMRIKEKGVKLCKTISALKLHECEDDYYPQQLKPLTNSLMEASDSLEYILEGILTLVKQLQASAKLQPTTQPVIFSWSAAKISETVNNILDSMQKECRLKKAVTENIAHCRDENLIEVYVSSWEFDVYFNLDECAYLFVEVGLPVITSN